jgi:hypothetical protein
MIRLTNALKTVAGAIILVSATARIADAGPPLVSDDPHTVGPSVVEAILAVEAVGIDDSVAMAAPVLDLTIGLLDGLDGTLVAAPLFDDVSGSSSDASELIEVGFKWQPLMTDSWNASFSPVVVVEGLGDRRVGGAFPLQVEFARDSWVVGIDGGYVLFSEGSDLWHGSTYAGWSTAAGPRLLAEIWSAGTANEQQGEVGAGLGIEWPLPLSLTLLASGGTEIASWGTPRVDWYSYVGVKWTFNAW